MTSALSTLRSSNSWESFNCATRMHLRCSRKRTTAWLGLLLASLPLRFYWTSIARSCRDSSRMDIAHTIRPITRKSSLTSLWTWGLRTTIARSFLPLLATSCLFSICIATTTMSFTFWGLILQQSVTSNSSNSSLQVCETIQWKLHFKFSYGSWTQRTFKRA